MEWNCFPVCAALEVNSFGLCSTPGQSLSVHSIFIPASHGTFFNLCVTTQQKESRSHSNHTHCNFKQTDSPQVAMLALLIRLDGTGGGVCVGRGRGCWGGGAEVEPL